MTRPTLLYLIKQVELGVRAHLDDVVRPAGLTALQYTALTVLEGHPDLTAAHLARRSFVSPQSTADLVAALVSRGLVDRHRDPADRRRLVLSLTEQGTRLLAELAAPVAAVERQLLTGLDEHAAGLLREHLERCRLALEHAPAAGRV